MDEVYSLKNFDAAFDDYEDATQEVNDLKEVINMIKEEETDDCELFWNFNLILLKLLRIETLWIFYLKKVKLYVLI